MSGRTAGRRPTVRDLARAAGVSLATVDRVLNNRPGVRAETVAKVEQASARIGFVRDVSASMLARARTVAVTVLLPQGPNAFFDTLAAALDREAERRAAERMQIAVRRIRALDAAALSSAIDALDPKACDCAVITAADTQDMRAAVDRAEARGIAVITLVSDLQSTKRHRFIGIDNVAAGRTAGALLGRFCPLNSTAGSRKIGLIAGSLELRDHRERLEGFAAVMHSDFPHVRLVGPVEGNDEPSATMAAAARLIADHPDLCAIYSMGAGNTGLVEALEATGRAGRIRVIAHELTPTSRRALSENLFDVVLDQDPAREVALALDTARRLALGGMEPDGDSPIELRLYLRDNMR